MSFKEKNDRNGKSYGGAVDLPQPAPPAFKPAETWPEMIKAWPKTTFCIVSNEFCERFSYYGMRTVLTLYLLNVLKFSDNASTVFFNGFTVLCYATPVLGSILADGYIGKFKTIMFVSLLYALGQIVLAFSSTQTATSKLHPMLDMLGLLIIAFGTGGIKPCVSAFGGDQFELGQERMLSIYFSLFYFSINAGSMISTFVSPIFRSQSCMNQDSCYPLAFGIPAILMIVATLIFLAGSFWYKKPPPKENIFAEVFRVMKQAIANKRFFDQKRDHWLDHYMDSHSCEHDEKCQALIRAGKRNSCHKREFVDDIKGLLRVAIMFLPVPMFWALYDQQGSRWLIQAVAMDCKLWGNALLLPDQMQTLNAVLILAFIPIFQVVVYPLVGKCVKLTALRKMVAGGLLACVAFVISAAVQLQVNTTLPDVPAKGQAFLSFANTFQNCNLTIAQSDSSFTPIHLAANSSLEDDKVKQIQQVLRLSSGKAYTWMISPTCYNGFTAPWNTLAYTSPALDSAKSFYVVVGNYGAYMTQAVWRKPTEGNGEFSLSINMATDVTTVTNLALCRREDNATNSNFPCDPGNDNNFYYWQLNYNDGTTDLGTDPEDDNLDNKTLSWTSPPNSPSPAVLNYINKPVRPGVWDLYYMPERAKDVDSKTPDRTKLPVNYTGISLEVEGQGGVFALIVTTDRSNNNMNAKSIYQIVPSNHISILWQIPQIAVLTAAEILFSITGYEFAYSQAAPSMKSLVQAMWLLTTAFGDTIIVIITLLNLFDNMAIELLFYAAIMLVVIIIFALISQFYYTYNDYTKGNDEDDDVSGVDNTGFEEEAVDEKPKY